MPGEYDARRRLGRALSLFACAVSIESHVYAQDSLTAASEVKGVQAVLLHCWNKASRDELKDVLATHNHFAISSAPYLGVSDTGDRNHNGNKTELVEPCSMASGQKDRLGNIGRLMSDLATTPEFHVVVFAANLHDRSAIAALPGQVAAIWTELIAPRADKPNFYFHLGASLEDEYSNSDVDKIFQSMATGIPIVDANTFRRLVAANRFSFHRSPGPSGDAHNTSVNVSVGGTKINDVPITHERHGRAPSAGYQVWSNDGPFVYWDRQDGREKKNEKCGTDNYCGLPPQSANEALPMAKFKSTMMTGRFRLLWRPAYNLFPWTNETTPGVTTRIFNKTPTLRSDASQSGFDSWEAEVLREFLK